MGGDKSKKKKKAVKATSPVTSNVSTADAEAGAKEKLLARKRKKSDASESKSSKNSSSSSGRKNNEKKSDDRKSDSKKQDSSTKKDEKQGINQEDSLEEEKKKSRSERRKQGRHSSRTTNNRHPELGRDRSNRGGFRDFSPHGDRRGPPPRGWGRGPPFRDDYRGPPPRGAHFDPFGRAPPGAFRGRGPPHPPRGRHPFDHGRRPIPPNRRDMNGRGGDGAPFLRGMPIQGRSISPPDYRGHRHRHQGRHARNHHGGRRRSSSRRSRSHDSSSSHSGRSRSFSQSSYSSSSSSSSSSSRDSYSSYDDNDSRSISRSRSRSSSPKNEKNQDGKQDKSNIESTKEVEGNSTSSKTSSSRAKRDRSQSLNEQNVVRRKHSRRRGRRQRRNRTDSHSSVSDRSSPSSSRSVSSSSRSHSSMASHSSNDDDEQNSHSSESNEGGRRNKERRRKRGRHHSRRPSRRTENSILSKDQRTVFVSQLVMRTTERDIKKYFKKKIGCKVHDVSLIRDRRNARNHKGCAYVEVGRIEDVPKALAVSGQPPDFQRFPILVKPSEAEKNYVHPNPSGAVVGTDVKGTASINAVQSAIASVSPTESGFKNIGSNVMPNKKMVKNSLAFLPPLKDENGNRIESKKVYVGGLDHAVTEQHLYALFSQFGTLLKVQLQLDLSTRLSRGYAFLAFHDPKVSNLAIQTMAGKIFAGGRPLKTGWANQSSSFSSGRTIVTSEELPDDAALLSQKALAVLSQMHGTSSIDNTCEHATVPDVENSLTGPTNQAVTALELSKAMMASSTPSTQSVDSSIIATAEEELDKAMGLMGAAPILSSVPTVAEARASMAATAIARQLAATAGSTEPPQLIGNADNPTRHLLVHNMYDKDEETDPGWEKDIEEEFTEECSNFGKIESVIVMHDLPGGKIYASFVDPACAKACAEKLAGRWFDKRQLKVDYTKEENVPLVK